MRSAADVLARQAARYAAGKTFVMASSREQLQQVLAMHDVPAYRAQQLLDGVYRARAHSIDDIVTLPKSLRTALSSPKQNAGDSTTAAASTAVEAPPPVLLTGRSTLVSRADAADGTTKALLRLHDGATIEAVAIPTPSRLTACVSSQVGCALRCAFCATGRAGYARNLMPHEIVDQVMWIGELAKRRVSHIVFMGQGEPCQNLPAVLHAVDMLNADPFALSARHITLSTVGVPHTLRPLADMKLQLTLAISLHNCNQAEREQIIPAAKAYPIDELLADADYYFAQTRRRVSFEVCLIAGLTDGPERARELAKVLSRRVKAGFHVNLMSWNPIDEAEDFRRPSRESVESFARILEDAGVTTTIRTSRGMDVNAACGQLRNASAKLKQ